MTTAGPKARAVLTLFEVIDTAAAGRQFWITTEDVRVSKRTLRRYTGFRQVV